jgi:hypothetical protein
MKTLMKNMTLIWLLLLVGCNSEDAPDFLQSRGSYVEEIRSMETFTGINAGEGIDVFLQQGEEAQVLVKGWNNLLPDVQIEVDEAGILQLEDQNSYNALRDYDNRTEIHITYVEQPTYFRVESNANMYAQDTLRNAFTFLGEAGGGEVVFPINNPSVSLGVNAMITLRFAGKTDWLGITNWGWAPLHLEGLPCIDAGIIHHGPSDIFVNVKNSLSTELFALGNVYYSGNPAITETRHGKGKTIKRGE